MSLYNQVSDRLAAGDLVGSIKTGIQSGISQGGAALLGQFGGGKIAGAAVGAVQNSASTIANQAFSKHLPAGLTKKINAASSVIGHAMRGDWDSAGLASIEGSAFNGLTSTLSGSAKQQRIMQTKSPLLGGGTLTNAMQMAEKVLGAGHIHKNLFILEVTSMAEGDQSEAFNLMALGVDYDPFNVTGEKLRVGGSQVDRVTGQEAVEMRFTTYDNANSDLKRFWARHHAATVARDGTVGVPANYAIKVRVLHGITTGAGGTDRAYADEGLFRVQTLTTNLSRQEQGLQELQMTLSQIDTFMRA